MMKVVQKWYVFFLALLCLTALAACQGATPAADSIPKAAPPSVEYDLPLPEPAPVPRPVPAPVQEPEPEPEPEPSVPSSAPIDGSEAEPSASSEEGSAGALAAEELPVPVEKPVTQTEIELEPSTPSQLLSASPQDASEPQLPPEPGNSTLYVLMYHSFVPDGTECNNWTLTDARLREDLQWLADNGYTTILPSELVAGEPLPEKAVMLTFDDGYANNYTVAYPLLREFQAKAVISLVVNHQFHQDEKHLSWDMCREMVQSGLVEIGSHTYNCHNNSPRGIQRMDGESQKDYETRVFADLQTSIDLIEENVGTAVQFFAYPHGQTEPWANDFLKEHFSLTVTTHHGSTDISKGLYDMNRYNVSMDTPLSSILTAG